jgi:hypothetical protein
LWLSPLWFKPQILSTLCAPPRPAGDKGQLSKTSPRLILADDLVYAHGGGKTQSKAEYIAEVTKGPSHYESFSESDINIRFYGKTAVLTGFVDVKPTKGEPYRVRTLEVYLEREGRWQLAQKESVRVTVRNASITGSH